MATRVATQFLCVVAAVAFIAAGAPGAAQTQARTASPTSPAPDPSRTDILPAYRLRLIGVYDFLSGQPVDSVTVTDLISGLSARTTPTGTASLFFLPDGGSLVRLRKLGYQPQNLEVHISPADTEPLTVLLEPATMLPTVVSRDSAPRYISPALGGFEQRQRSGFGSFIDEAEMRKKENWTMANLVTSHFSGLMTAVSPHGEEYVTSTRKMCAGLALARCSQPNCYPSVYVDGIQYHSTARAGGNAVDLSKWSPMDFEAAEFYSSVEVPGQFAGINQECGVLLLWTRER